MDSISSIFLGIIQGLTEFLPVSSSGHLVVFQNILGFQEPEILLDISLHIGTLLAVCIFFRNDLKVMLKETWFFIMDMSGGRIKITRISERPEVMLTMWIIVGTIPTSLIGLIFKSPLENLFGDVNRVGYMLICTGVLVAVTRLIPASYSSRKKVGLLTAMAVGTAQGLAIIPGISRSGATIVCGMICGMDRELSGRFSFLLSIPAIAGALVLELGSKGFGEAGFMPLVLGFLSAAVVGLLALKILMGLVRKGSLFYFAPYCWLLGLFIIFR